MASVACCECAAPLTSEERAYYGSRCERCEQEWSERIEEWRHGGRDDDLDRTYEAERPSSH